MYPFSADRTVADVQLSKSEIATLRQLYPMKIHEEGTRKKTSSLWYYGAIGLYGVVVCMAVVWWQKRLQEPETITTTTNLYDDLGMDSLGLFSLGMFLVRTYAINVPIASVAQIETVHDIYTLMKNNGVVSKEALVHR